MTDPALVPEHSVATGVDEEGRPPRSDLKDALGWLALGIAVLVASIRMDRLEQQNINPVTVPGLLPGLLGIAMILLGGALAVRSLRRGALHIALPAATPGQHEQNRRVAIVLALCLAYGVGLVGHGLPFWVASSIFVTVTILTMDRIGPRAHEWRLTPRRVIQALAIGLGAAIAIELVFQELFLVRLP